MPSAHHYGLHQASTMLHYWLTARRLVVLGKSVVTFHSELKAVIAIGQLHQRSSGKALQHNAFSTGMLMDALP